MGKNGQSVHAKENIQESAFRMREKAEVRMLGLDVNISAHTERQRGTECTLQEEHSPGCLILSYSQASDEGCTFEYLLLYSGADVPIMHNPTHLGIIYKKKSF